MLIKKYMKGLFLMPRVAKTTEEKVAEIDSKIEKKRAEIEASEV